MYLQYDCKRFFINSIYLDETAPESTQQSKSEGLGTEPETENVQIEKERQYNETEREETEAEQGDMESEAAINKHPPP